MMMLAIDLLLLAIFVAVGRGSQSGPTHSTQNASLCFKLDLDNCTSAQVLLVVKYQDEVSLACQRCSVSSSSEHCFSIIISSNFMNFHWIDTGTCSVGVSNVKLNTTCQSQDLSTMPVICGKIGNRTSSTPVKFCPFNVKYNKACSAISAPDTSLCLSSVSTTSSSPSSFFVTTSSQSSLLLASQLYSNDSVSVFVTPSSTKNDVSQTESSATSTYASGSTGFQTSSIIVAPSSTSDVISFSLGSLTSSSEYLSTSIQPCTSITPTSSELSHHFSTSTLTISFPSFSVLPSSSPFFYCTTDDQWPETKAGYTANGTCYKGTVNATRYCNETGEWNETVCHTSESFGAILSLISSSPQKALTSLSQQVDGMPVMQAVVLLDTIVGSSSNDTDTEEFTIRLLSVAEKIADETSTISDENVRQSIGSQILLTLDSFALSLDRNFTLTSDNIVLNAQRILSLTGNRLTGIDFKGNEIVLPSEIFIERDIPFTAASFVYLNMSSLLVSSNKKRLISPVVSSALNCSTDSNISNCITTNLTQLVNISFSLSDQKMLKTTDLSCAFWNFTKSSNSLPTGAWNREGCELVVAHDIITCQCDHLTHFGILLSPRSETGEGSIHDKILSTIGKILVPVSLLCMLLVILTYTCMRSLWTMRNYIHVMLTTNLFVSQLIFLIGIEQTNNQSVCSGIAVVLQYMFLVTFMWMLMEGIVLYVTLVKIFIKSTKYYIIAFTLISYGVPAIYMIVIAPIGLFVGTSGHNHYILYKDNQPIACWLDYESGFIWSFIAPVILIIFANIVFFIMTIYIIRGHQAKHPEKAKRVQTKHWIKVSLSLSIAMGIGWIGCVLFFSKHLIFIAYIMTVFIAGQGIIIFILYVPVSKQVREAYAAWWRGKKANPVILLRYIPILSVSSQNMDRIEVKITPTSYDNKYTYSGSYKEQKNGDTGCEKSEEKQTSFSS